jgi:hypothetical protein
LAIAPFFFAVLAGLTVVRGLMACAPGLPAVALLAAFGFAVVAVGLAAVRALAAVTVLPAVPWLATVRLPVLRLAVVRLAVVRLAADGVDEVLAVAGLRAAVFFGAAFAVLVVAFTALFAAVFAATAGFAADMLFAAAVSSLEAIVMALVAALIACSAVDIVLAEEVALVAAVVILVAAEVTFAAADDTVRAAAAAVGAVLTVRDFAVAGLAVALAAGRAVGLAATRRVAPLRVRAVVLAAPRRTGLRAVDCRGIDLPPVVINYGGAIPRLAATYTSLRPENPRWPGLMAVNNLFQTPYYASGTRRQAPLPARPCAQSELAASAVDRTHIALGLPPGISGASGRP